MTSIAGKRTQAMVLLLGMVAWAGPAWGAPVGQTAPPAPMGYALAIGLNAVDPAQYEGWSGELFGCEPDAQDMRDIAAKQGFQAEMLLTAQATRAAVLEKLDTLAKTLQPGDLLVVSYSGHGGQVPDLNNDEEDGKDETWCLYDGELIDDELYGAWMKFRPGARILAFSDSCHSGTITKMKRGDYVKADPNRLRELGEKWKAEGVPAGLDRARLLALPEMREATKTRPVLRERVRNLPPAATRSDRDQSTPPVADTQGIFVSRAMPPEISYKVYAKHEEFYSALGKAAPPENAEKIAASVLLISGCADPETSADLGFNGLFTWVVKKVWDSGAFKGDYRKFHAAILKKVKQNHPKQSPCLAVIGGENETFIRQRPYAVK